MMQFSKPFSHGFWRYCAKSCTYSLTFLLLLLTMVTQAQDPAQFGTPFSGVPNRMDANIYQMNLREYSTTRNIAGARQKLQRVKDLGVNVIYLMPIFPVGVTNNAAGSPYCNSDYKSVAPDLGTLTDLRGLVSDAHNLGMAVILDFIVNQTSWDHPWVTQHPDWYIKDGSGNIASPCPSPGFCFTDVAGIDLNQAGAANAMIDAMRYWVFAANVDGFRFDWADQGPQAFWTNAVSNLRGITTHNLLLLAEGSNEGSSSGCTSCGQNQPGAHYTQGFDYIFGTNFYWNVMKKVWNSGEPAKNLDGVTSGEYTGAGSTQLVARFLSNHDDYNADGSPFSFLSGGRNAAMSAFVVATYHRGVPFIYNGIEVGNTNPLPFPWNSGNINWTQDLTVYTEMQKILNFRNSSTALRRGTPTSFIDPANTNPDIIAFTKTNGTEKVAVLVNVRNGSRNFTIPSGMAGSYVNAFTNASVTLTSGSSVTLTAYQYLVLTNASVPVVPVTGVSVTPTSVSVSAGLTTQLSASVAPSNATNQNVTWSSSNSAVATVSASGLVTGVAAGTATITVTTQDGNKTASATVTVNPASTFTVHFFKPSSWGNTIRIYWWAAQPTGVLADGSWPGVTMTDEGSGWYKYTFTNVTSTNLIFNDGTSQSADLSRNGTNGWYYNGAWYNSQPATVAVTGVSVTPTSATLSIGGTQQLSATVSPSNATNKTVSWSSSNTGVATVNSTGLVTAVGGGTATITVTTQDGGKTATSTLTVQVSAISLPGTVQAENWTSMSGVQTENTTDTGGGLNVGWIDAGDWMDYSVNVAAAGTYTVSFRMASGGSGGTVQLRNSAGSTLCSASVGGTGGWQNWTTITATATLSAGTQTIRLYASTGGYNINYVTFAQGGSSGTSYYIKNRWQGTYLYDNGTNVAYGVFSTASSRKWELVDVDGHKALKNVGTGEYMNIEALTGTVQCTSIGTGAWSAQWAVEDYDGHKRFRNRWQSAQYIHIENLTGNAQHGTISAGAWSNQWILESAGSARLTEETLAEVLAERSAISVYPNPVNHTIQFTAAGWEQDSVNLKLMDVSGKVIWTRNAQMLTNELNVADLKQGVYMLQVQQGEFNQVIRFIKK